MADTYTVTLSDDESVLALTLGATNGVQTLNSSAGTFTVLHTIYCNPQAVLTITGGTLVADALVGSVQNVVLAGGMLNGGFGSSISNLTWITGTLQGANTITGSANWTGGLIGAGSTLTIATNAVLNINGSNTLSLAGVLINAGTVNWAGTGTVEVYNAGAL